MSLIEQHISKVNNWTIEYCNKVIFEFERFLSIKISDNNVYPSNDINKLWESIILNTEFYINYCNQKFNKIIYFNQIENNDETTKKNKILNLFKLYKTMYGEFKYPEVWNYTITLTPNDINTIMNSLNTQNNVLTMPQNDILNQNQTQNQTQNQNQINTIPNYQQNKPVNGEIKLYFYFKDSVPSNATQFDKKIVGYIPTNQTDTVESLKNLILNDIKIDKNNVNILLHPEIVINGLDKYVYFFSTNTSSLKSTIFLKDLVAKSYNFLIIEMTSGQQINNNLFNFNK
jgi:hypothetical protein